MDYILNGQAHGDVSAALMQYDMQPGPLRPFIDQNGRQYFTVNQMDPTDGKVKPRAVPVANATSTLRKDEWQHLDDAILKVARPRLRFVGDLMSAGLTYNLPAGMGHTILQHETVSDGGEANIGLDPIQRGSTDRPKYELNNLPLPIVWSDFQLSLRQIMTSRNKGIDIDTTMAEQCSRRVAEKMENLALGKLSTYTYGGGSVYGLTNYPNRLTKTLTSPASAGWTPSTLVTEVLEMREQSQNAYYYGPFMIYHSPNWDKYLDEDYSAAKDTRTLRQRLMAIEDINAVRRADYLTNYDFVLVQFTADVIREVVGMGITVVRWESQGGYQINFKVLGLMVPQLRADQNSNTGIVHGSV